MITQEDLKSMIYDPAKMQMAVLNFIEDETNGDIAITDPTNPVTLLLETALASSSAAAHENLSNMRKYYPIMATSYDELLHHISDDELTSMFAIPSETEFLFYVNVTDIRMNGITNDEKGYCEITIPLGTRVSILNTDFTTLNDISVKLFNNGSVQVEQIVNNINDMAVNDLGVLTSGKYTDKNGVQFIWFTTRIKQVKRYVYNLTSDMSTGLNETFEIDNSYCQAEIFYIKDNIKYKMSKTHNEEFIDILTPTAVISLAGNLINIRIPTIYFTNNLVSSSFYIEIYDTKGKIYLPINEYDLQDFTITLGDTSSSISSAASTKVAILATSQSIVDGGKDALTIDEVRDAIIYRTTGDIDLPITEKQLERKAELQNYNISKVIDTLTGRTYISTRNDDKAVLDGVNAYQDVYFNMVNITKSSIPDSVIKYENGFIIKSNTIFKENNSVITILDSYMTNLLYTMDSDLLVTHLYNNNYYYTPFYYLLKYSNNYIECLTYDLDNPTIDNFKIVSKNISMTPVSVNTNRYSIKKTNSGYQLRLELKGSGEYEALKPNNLSVQASLTLDNNEKAFFNGYKADNNDFIIDIDCDLDLEVDDMVNITNDITHSLRTKSSLVNKLDVYIITNTESSDYLKTETYNLNQQTAILTKETFDITFGKRLNYIWNNTAYSYTDRKYKRYENKVYRTYKDNVYELNDAGSVFHKEDGKLVKKILHNKGDYVLDENNQQILEHDVGDVILDENNLPTIDTESGLVYHVDICMIGVEFLLANSVAHINYRELMLKRLRSYIIDDMSNLNNLLLENTEVLYKTNKAAKPVNLTINNMRYYSDYLIQPSVTIYVDTTTALSNDEISLYKKKIGTLLDNALNKKQIKLEDLKKDIMNSLSNNVKAVRIVNLEPSNSEMVKYTSSDNTPSVSKKLTKNKYNELVVEYNVGVEIQYI